jgi:hypothetical protein
MRMALASSHLMYHQTTSHVDKGARVIPPALRGLGCYIAVQRLEGLLFHTWHQGYGWHAPVRRLCSVVLAAI